jgi:hypothetical protein
MTRRPLWLYFRSRLSRLGPPERSIKITLDWHIPDLPNA